MMEWIYWSISWILLRWHDVWAAVLPGSGQFIGTNWEWVLSIVFLVITVRIIIFPIFVKQIHSQRAMQVLQPKVKALQEKHKGDQQTLRVEMMKLYQEEKVNPLMGCLPMLLQIPVFLGLFKVLSHLNPLRNGGKELWGWSAAEFDSAANAKLFGAPISMAFKSSAADVTAVGGGVLTVKLVAAVLVLLMMFTTFMTSRQMILKTGWSQDPQQKMIQRLMLYGIPISLLLSGWAFPIGVITYWVVQNVFSFGQQYWVLHKYPPPVMAGAAPGGGTGLFGRLGKSDSAKAGATTKGVATTSKPSARPTAAPGAGANGGKDKRTGGKTGATTRGSSVNGSNKSATEGGGVVSQAGERSGLFGRKRDAAKTPVAPVPQPQARAPKPGAKPTNPKKGGSKRG